MSMPICRFCDSGVPWNNCSCTFAKAATITGYADAQKRFLASGGTLQPKPGAGAESARSPVNREATADESAHSTVEGRFAPPGDCDWCDKERARNAERVQKHRRAKQKGQEG